MLRENEVPATAEADSSLSRLGRRLLTTKEAAALLRKNTKTLERWRDERRGPRWYQPEGRGTSVYYLEHEVVAFALGRVGAA